MDLIPYLQYLLTEDVMVLVVEDQPKNKKIIVIEIIIFILFALLILFIKLNCEVKKYKSRKNNVQLNDKITL